MAKRYIVTVGTSLVDNFARTKTTDYQSLPKIMEARLPKGAERVLNEEPQGLLGTLDPDRPQVLDLDNVGAHWFLAHYHNKGIEHKNPPPAHCAEIATLAHLGLQAEDEVLLLCSDTGLGAFCAVVIALLLTGSADRVQTQHVRQRQLHLSELPDWGWPPPDYNRPLHSSLQPLQRTRVHIRHVPQLNPEQFDEFAEHGAANLIRIVHQAVHKACNGTPKLKPEIVFTGGYKAAVPLLTYAAGWLGGVPLNTLYQDSDQVLRLPALALEPPEHVRELVLNPPEQADLTARTRPYFNADGTQLSLLGQVLQQTLLPPDKQEAV
jgi:hypothetical protein